jgi:hypothetical protein
MVNQFSQPHSATWHIDHMPLKMFQFSIWKRPISRIAEWHKAAFYERTLISPRPIAHDKIECPSIRRWLISGARSIPDRRLFPHAMASLVRWTSMILACFILTCSGTCDENRSFDNCWRNRNINLAIVIIRTDFNTLLGLWLDQLTFSLPWKML